MAQITYNSTIHQWVPVAPCRERSGRDAKRATTHQQYQPLYDPTKAHSVKNVQLLKHIKIMEAAPTCFGLQKKHHKGATASA